MASLEHRSAYCHDCDRRRKFIRPAVNHILHLLITVLLCGAWLPVWLALTLIPRPWRCDECGVAGEVTLGTLNREPIVVFLVAVIAFISFALILYWY